ncbi:MAG: response regulator receiver modulated CheB methylesterase, partial [Planctomycetaceae bacterium]|nr:response regulator receiver modulated CheB methylesterase [Planctomycetaceae bacterium]
LTAIRETRPTLPVIIFSRLTERGSQTTVDALLLGASDYVTKPDDSTALEHCVRVELTAKIKTLAAVQRAAPPETRISRHKIELKSGPLPGPLAGQSVATQGSARVSPARQANSVAEIVAIATSTGGPNALAFLLSSLPPSFATPIVIVQHMASGFTTTLAESLRRQTGRDVQEVSTAMPLNAAAVWIAPGGRHLIVNRQGVVVQVVPDDGPPENSCCPSADVLFRSVALEFGSRCLAVVLTGMGYDGLAGCRAIQGAGGRILVQDQASSVSWGMPGQVASAGLADQVLSLTDLPNAICRYARRSG